MEKTFLREARGLTDVSRYGQERSRWLKYAAVALLLLLPAYFVYDYLDAPGNDTLFARYFQPYEDLLSTRAGEAASSALTAGMAFYNDHDYAAAADQFEEVLKTDPQHRLVRLYAGISYLQQDSTEKAKHYFEGLANEPGMLREQGRWYLALTHLKSGDNRQAAEVLNLLTEEENAYKEKAKELLKVIS